MTLTSLSPITHFRVTENKAAVAGNSVNGANIASIQAICIHISTSGLNNPVSTKNKNGDEQRSHNKLLPDILMIHSVTL
ncbi:hypothetical protein D3C77_784790 [compost metagenome]